MFEKLSLKSRLLLIATVPITVMLILGISGAWEKYSDYQSRVQAETLVGLVVDLFHRVLDPRLKTATAITEVTA